MIMSETEYRVTQRAAERLQHALDADESTVAQLSEAARDLLRRSVAGQLQELRDQLAEYEARAASAPVRTTGHAVSTIAGQSTGGARHSPRALGDR